MVSALVSGSIPGRGHCVVFLGKTLYSHSASLELHPGVQMSTGERNARGNPAVDLHPIQGGVEILLAASCYRNYDKLRPDGPLSLVCRLPLPAGIKAGYDVHNVLQKCYKHGTYG